MSKLSQPTAAHFFLNAMKPKRRKPHWREFFGRIWLMLAALALIVMLNDCMRTQVELDSGLVDIGDGLAVKPDGTVVEAAAEQDVPVWAEGLQAWSAWAAASAYAPNRPGVHLPYDHRE